MFEDARHEKRFWRSRCVCAFLRMLFKMRCFRNEVCVQMDLVTTVFPTLNPWEQAKLALLNEREIKSEISLFFRRKQSKDQKISASDEINLSDT